MLCVVIKGPSFQEAHQQISEALAYADLVELRLDCFEILDLAALKRLRSAFSLPMIFTLRSQMQGGNYTQSEETRLANIRLIATLKPEYLDLESHITLQFIHEISSQYPDIRLILSYHNFSETPEDLEGLYQKMQTRPAFFYKIVVTAQNSLDAMRFMCWAKKTDNKLIAISMGSHGQVSRILGPIIGCPITYSALEENQITAPGQLSAKMLIERYHHHSLNSRTAIYGLIGDPVSQSISDETHNNLIACLGLDAVYVKIQISASELPEFLQFAKQLPFHGISITMPLKEHIIPFLDRINAEAYDIGAVNTLVFENDKVFGFNTDGIGALDALEQQCRVKGKHIVIVGAGGAAKAIAYEAIRREGIVTIVNRDPEKALQIARSLGCIGKGLESMAECVDVGYDILINCTPVSEPISFDHILSEAIVMDITTKPKETVFLKHAVEKGCRVIYGYQMFVEQAACQFNLWFKDRIDIQESRKMLAEMSLASVALC